MLYSSDRCPACFYTDGRPLCWRWCLLDTESQIAATLRTLLSLPLHSCWVSAFPYREEIPQSQASVDARLLTPLNLDTQAAFIKDLMERDFDGYGREILILGLSKAYRRGMNLSSEVEKFLYLQSSLVRLAILRLEDGPCDYVYLQPEDMEARQAWLPILGIDERKPVCRYPYGRLRTAALDVRLTGLRDLLNHDHLAQSEGLHHD